MLVLFLRLKKGIITLLQHYHVKPTSGVFVHRYKRHWKQLPRTFWLLLEKKALTLATISRQWILCIIFLTRSGLYQLWFSKEPEPWICDMVYVTVKTHSDQEVYEIKTSLLLIGRDGDTIMSSESSESIAAVPPDSTVEWSSGIIWSLGNTHVYNLL